ncbi:hypothetical protein [Granulosicoccus antarcticus]|uniref:OmpA-like domain-containing protein n=1 Tax=Granulosicoccus antarcticus IMCC3135 TaxID=1192854 RepID=A0A2Z2P1P6_9GAMM|nr:hypothetical protein [Granulosicoccus antarcticus]ASJ74397.1 hypothetical protein IMCC3135_21600 [Granulosicoccus antarcticus IMCC3135]
MIQLSGNRAEYPAWKPLVAICLLGSSLALSACAVTDTPISPASLIADKANRNIFGKAAPVPTAYRTMVNDLSDVVVQIFDPRDTTLQVTRSNADPILQYFVQVLAEHGFGIQRVSADQGAQYLQYELRSIDDENGVLVSLNVGPVVATRYYQLLRDNVVTPTSVVQLAGTRAPVTVADTPTGRFKVSNPAFSQVQYVAAMSLDEQSPIISLVTPDVINSATSQSARGPSLQALNSSKVEVTNLFFGTESNFASILDGHEQVDRQIVVFGNDSMILGDTNKQLIDQFVDEKLEATDVISLVGCSNGPTALDIGNEGLALGRGRRVIEALMARGVSREQILDEGCWAPTKADDRFPSRGVVLELWRSQS